MEGSSYFTDQSTIITTPLTPIETLNDDNFIEVTPEIEASWENSKCEIEEKYKLIQDKIKELKKFENSKTKEINDIIEQLNELEKHLYPGAPQDFTLNENAKVQIIVSEIAPYGQPPITKPIKGRILDVVWPIQRKIGIEKDSFGVWDLQHKHGNFTFETKSLKGSSMKIISFTQLEGTIKEFCLAFLIDTKMVALTGRTIMENKIGKQSFLLPTIAKANTVKIIVFDTYGDKTARLSDVEIYSA